jgi:hypothetical protein
MCKRGTGVLVLAIWGTGLGGSVTLRVSPQATKRIQAPAQAVSSLGSDLRPPLHPDEVPEERVVEAANDST